MKRKPLGLLLILSLLGLQLCVESVKAVDRGHVVLRATGSALQWFENTTDWANEDEVSYQVSIYISSLFWNSPAYNRRYYGNDVAVSKSNILGLIQEYNGYNYATFFIYTHGINRTMCDVVYQYVYPYGYIPVACYPVEHYQFWDSYDQAVNDYEIWPKTSSGVNYFVFIWACAQGKEVGRYHASYWIYYPYVYYAGTGAAGMPCAWTRRDYTQMNSDGYANPDSSPYCFIGFEGWSKPMSEQIDGTNKNYGNFAKIFYQNLLQDGDSIKKALDDASFAIWGTNFGGAVLYNGYWDNVPGRGLWFGKMHVYSNGNNILPH
ncbi:MAG: hypothetical protein QXM52_01660 [Candidatus Bathyarchaeia archaeon]